MIQAIHHAVGAYQRGGGIGPAKWSHYDVIVVTRGDATFQIGGKAFPCTGGSALLVPPEHEFVGMAGVHGCVLWVQHFDLKKRGSLDPVRHLPRVPVLWRGTAASDWARSLLRQASLQQKRATKSRAALAQILSLLIQTLRGEGGDLDASEGRLSRDIAKVIEELATRPHPLPTIEELARTAGWSESHFRSAFRRQAGRTIGGFLREIRMQEACRLLIESNLPIKEISSGLGYSVQVAFHRAFTKFTGTPPGRFRSAAPRIV